MSITNVMGGLVGRSSRSGDFPVSSCTTDTPRFLDDIARYVNLNELRPILVEENLLKEEDLAADLGKAFNEFSKKDDRKDYLKWQMFADPSGRDAFRRCIEKSVARGNNNLGHNYILTLLDDTKPKFADSSAIQESKSLQIHMKDKMEMMVKSIKPGSALYGRMVEKKLLTLEEFEKFSSNNCTDIDNNKKIFALLKIKGPTAHQLFMQCLFETRKEVPTHGELYDILTGMRGCQDLSISYTSSLPLSPLQVSTSCRIDYLKGKE